MSKTLSDEIMFQMGDEELDEDNMVCHVDDIKSSVEQLKEIMWYLPRKKDTILSHKFIDQIFGEKLSSNVHNANLEGEE